MTLAAVTPWKPVRRSGSMPYSCDQRTHERSTAAIESMSVPSMSSRTPSNGVSKGASRGTSTEAEGGMGATLGRRPRVDRMPHPAGRPRTAVLSATTAAVALIGGWTWAAAVQPEGFDPRVESISALAASATAHRWVMATALVITGLAHIVTAWALVPARPVAGRVLLAAPEGSPRWASPPCHFPRAPSPRSRTPWSLPPRSSSSECGPGSRHARTDLLSSTPRVARPAAAVLTVSVASLAVGLGGTAFGLHERVVAASTVIWPLVTAVGLWWWAGHRVGPRRVRLGLALGGVDRGVRDRRGGCHGRRPGHRRDPALPVQRHPGPQPGSQLRAGRDDRLRRHRGRVLRPRPRRACRSAGQGEHHRPCSRAPASPCRPFDPDPRSSTPPSAPRPSTSWSGSPPVPSSSWCSPGSGMPCCAGGDRRSASSSAGSSRVWPPWPSPPGRCGPPTARTGRRRSPPTGVLGTLQQNQGILSDVEARSAQVAPYLRNVIALSTALQQKYAAAPLESETSVRVLARERHPRRQPVRPHAQHRRGGVHRCRRRRG